MNVLGPDNPDLPDHLTILHLELAADLRQHITPSHTSGHWAAYRGNGQLIAVQIMTINPAHFTSTKLGHMWTLSGRPSDIYAHKKARRGQCMNMDRELLKSVWCEKPIYVTTRTTFLEPKTYNCLGSNQGPCLVL